MHASSIYGHVLQCYGSLLMLGVIALILSPVNAKEPCDFFDTVNVTGDRRLTDGSYVHENVTIPAAQVAQYSYIYKYRGEKIEVEPHLRGCICHLKPCLNVCNGWGNMNLNRSESSLNVTFLDGTTSLVDVAEQFVLQEQRICNDMYLLLPEDNFSWLLNDKAVLWEEVQNINRTKADFCVTQFEWPKASGQYSIQPAVCIETSEFVVKTQINGIVMWLSIPFMLLTIAVYLIIPELRKCNGKLLACWLSSLSIAYSIHPTLAFGIHTQYSIGCKLAGYSIYYFIMAAFLWHNAMSFDTWRTVRNMRAKSPFLLYSLFAWGTALVLLLFTLYAREQADWIGNDWKPQIGREHCWFDMEHRSTGIYFIGPLLLIMVANIVMFVMAVKEIHSVHRNLHKHITRGDSARSLQANKNRFALFLRLFVVMGITWTPEVVSFFLGKGELITRTLYIFDIIISLQGIIICILFVAKKQVTNLIFQREALEFFKTTRFSNRYCTREKSLEMIQMEPQL